MPVPPLLPELAMPAGAAALLEPLSPELQAYREEVYNEQGARLGVVTRGEGASLSDRVQQALTGLGLSDHERRLHARLASAFDHRNQFVKVEWHGTTLSVSTYFRRRPKLHAWLPQLAAFGVAPGVCRELEQFARGLKKDTVHFAAVRFCPGGAPEHKLYLAQPVAPELLPDLERRLAALFGDAAPRAWRAAHRATTRGVGEGVVFASLNFTPEAVRPGFKLDYLLAGPQALAAWVGEAAAVQLGARFTAAPSYVGARYVPGAPTPSLKLYVGREAPTTTRS